MSAIREKFIGRATTLVGDRRSTLRMVLKGKSLHKSTFNDFVMFFSWNKSDYLLRHIEVVSAT